jgi:hypothetical protein
MADLTTAQIDGAFNYSINATIKHSRVHIDALMQLCTENIQSAECTLALRNLQMAKGWLSELLEYWGEKSPYTVAQYPIDIPATTDTAIKPILVFAEHLDFVNYICEAIQSEIMNQPIVKDCDNRLTMITNNVITHLSEARMWYGYELQNIKKKFKPKSNEEQ